MTVSNSIPRGLKLSTLALVGILIGAIYFSMSRNNAITAETKLFLEQVKQQAVDKGDIITVASLEAGPDDTVLVRDFNYQDKTNDQSFDIKEMSFTNLAKVGANGFSFDRLEAKNFTQKRKSSSGDDVVITIEKISAMDLDYPDLAERKSPIWPLDLNEAELTNIKLELTKKDGKTYLQTPGLKVLELRQTDDTHFSINNIAVQPITGTSTDAEAQFTLSFDGFSASAAEYLGNSGFSVEAFEIGKFNLDGKTNVGEKIGIDVAGIDGQNLYSPNTANPDAPLFPKETTNLEMGPVEFRLNGDKLVGFQSASGGNTFDEEQSIVSGTGEVKDIYLDLTKIPVTRENKTALDSLAEHGYETLTMNVSGGGLWNTKSGLLQLDSYRIELEDVAALELSGKVSGYTEGVARKISKLSNDANLESDEQKRAALSFQMLEAVSALTVDQLALKVEDKSALNRIIKLQAAKSNQDPKSIVTVVPFLVSSLLSPFNVPELSTQIREALSIFMQGEKTIIIRAAPEEPLSISQILSMGVASQTGALQPAEIVEQLNVEILAK